MPNSPKTIKTKPPAPDSQSWYEYIWKAEQETPNRLEDAAKFLATMISISLTLFLSIGKSSLENSLSGGAVFIKISGSLTNPVKVII